jgi:hypothetical protein
MVPELIFFASVHVKAAGKVLVFRQQFALEDAIGSQACSHEASMRVANGTPLGWPLLLPVGTVNSVQTRKLT